MGMRQIVRDHLESVTRVMGINPPPLLMGIRTVIWDHLDSLTGSGLATLFIANGYEQGCFWDHVESLARVWVGNPPPWVWARSFGTVWSHSPKSGLAIFHTRYWASDKLFGTIWSHWLKSGMAALPTLYWAWEVWFGIIQSHWPEFNLILLLLANGHKKDSFEPLWVLDLSLGRQPSPISNGHEKRCWYKKSCLGLLAVIDSSLSWQSSPLANVHEKRHLRPFRVFDQSLGWQSSAQTVGHEKGCLWQFGVIGSSLCCQLSPLANEQFGIMIRVMDGYPPPLLISIRIVVLDNLESLIRVWVGKPTP